MDAINALVAFFLKPELETKEFPQKSIKDLELNEFLFFRIKNGQRVGRRIGIFKVVSSEEFVLKGFAAIQPGRPYQVQKQRNNTLFLRGKREKFIYSKP